MKSNMFSLISKAKKVSVLATSALKVETCCSSQRTYASKCILKTNSTFKTLNCRLYSNSPKDLGKIMELDVEFDEVRLDDRYIKRERKPKKKNKASYIKFNNNEERNENILQEFQEDLEEESMEISNEEIKSQGKTSKPNDQFDENTKVLSYEMTLLKSRKNREKNQQIIIEGKRLIHDAISAGCEPLKIFTSRRSDLEKLNLPEGVKVYLVPYRNLQLWSSLVTSQGVIGIFKKPKPKISNTSSDTLPLTVICDNIRDPGNLGSILRVVAGVGCSKLMLTKGCVDIWESKVLRAGAGAHFCLPIVNELLWSDIKSEISENSRVVLADLSFYHNTRDENELSDGNNSFQTRSELSKSLPVQCYHSIKYSESENTVLVVGGETHGLSNDAYEFAVERKGVKAFIPLCNGIESLNSSVALGIFTYEIKRQIDCLLGKEYQSNYSAN